MLEQRGNNLVFRYGLDDLAFDENLTLAIAGGHAQISLARLPWAIDDAAHDRHANRRLDIFQPFRHLLGELNHIDLRAPAARAGDDVEMPLAKTKILKNLAANLDFLDRRRGQGHANRVPDAFSEQRTERKARLDSALPRRPGLGHAQMQRPIALAGEQTVRLDHGDRIMVFDGNLEIVETNILEHAGFLQRRSDEGLRGRSAVFRIQLLVERPGVHTDTQRNARIRGRLANRRPDLVELADIARVDTYRGAPGINRLENILALEMDVGNHRKRGFRDDGGQRVCIILTGHGDADDVATRLRELTDLAQRGVHVHRRGVGHRLHGNRGAAADGHRTDHNAAGLAPRMQRAFADIRGACLAELRLAACGQFIVLNADAFLHTCLFIKTSARWRASCSTCPISSTDANSGSPRSSASIWSITALTVSTMPRYGSRPSRNA